MFLANDKDTWTALTESVLVSFLLLTLEKFLFQRLAILAEINGAAPSW